jgi:14-3-3 protein epsilon
LDAYKKTQELAKEQLDTTDPVRLGLDLNFSVFYYEIMKDPKMACDIAKRSFDDAIYDIENIADKNYKDSTTIMQLMRDNLNLWSSELEEGLDSSSDEGM